MKVSKWKYYFDKKNKIFVLINSKDINKNDIIHSNSERYDIGKNKLFQKGKLKEKDFISYNNFDVKYSNQTVLQSITNKSSQEGNLNFVISNNKNNNNTINIDTKTFTNDKELNFEDNYEENYIRNNNNDDDDIDINNTKITDFFKIKEKDFILSRKKIKMPKLNEEYYRLSNKGIENKDNYNDKSNNNANNILIFKMIDDTKLYQNNKNLQDNKNFINNNKISEFKNPFI